MQQNQNEVDINILISLYNKKLSQLSNQIILLEAKLETLTEDYIKQKEELLKANLDLQENLENFSKNQDIDVE